jgi:hypothetical protein
MLTKFDKLGKFFSAPLGYCEERYNNYEYIKSLVFVFVCVCVVLETVKPGTRSMPGKHTTTELHPSAPHLFFFGSTGICTQGLVL